MSVPQTSSLPALQRGVFLSRARRGKVNVAHGTSRVALCSLASLDLGSSTHARGRRRDAGRISSISATSIPTIQQDMRYAGSGNFTGAKVPGYDAAECVLVRQAAEALKAVQADVKAKGLTLKVYDCYRPARAVAAFVAWAKQPDDPKAKTTYYPNLPKSALFPDYIATRSGHSRGATLDLTLVWRRCGRPGPNGDERQAPRLHGTAKGARARRQPRHGHELRLLRREGEHGGVRLEQGGAGESRPAGRGHAGARLQELPAWNGGISPSSRSPTPTRSSISRLSRASSGLTYSSR